ncbi:hypothetical protein BH24BAC1_BH24BAC1_38910 [soil metagenome]
MSQPPPLVVDAGQNKTIKKGSPFSWEVRLLRWVVQGATSTSERLRLLVLTRLT